MNPAPLESRERQPSEDRPAQGNVELTSLPFLEQNEKGQRKTTLAASQHLPGSIGVSLDRFIEMLKDLNTDIDAEKLQESLQQCLEFEKLSQKQNSCTSLEGKEQVIDSLNEDNEALYPDNARDPGIKWDAYRPLSRWLAVKLASCPFSFAKVKTDFQVNNLHEVVQPSGVNEGKVCPFPGPFSPNLGSNKKTSSFPINKISKCEVVNEPVVQNITSFNLITNPETFATGSYLQKCLSTLESRAKVRQMQEAVKQPVKQDPVSSISVGEPKVMDFQINAYDLSYQEAQEPSGDTSLNYTSYSSGFIVFFHFVKLCNKSLSPRKAYTVAKKHYPSLSDCEKQKLRNRYRHSPMTAAQIEEDGEKPIDRSKISPDSQETANRLRKVNRKQEHLPSFRENLFSWQSYQIDDESAKAFDKSVDVPGTSHSGHCRQSDKQTSSTGSCESNYRSAESSNSALEFRDSCCMNQESRTSRLFEDKSCQTKKLNLLRRPSQGNKAPRSREGIPRTRTRNQRTAVDNSTRPSLKIICPCCGHDVAVTQRDSTSPTTEKKKALGFFSYLAYCRKTNSDLPSYKNLWRAIVSYRSMRHRVRELLDGLSAQGLTIAQTKLLRSPEFRACFEAANSTKRKRPSSGADLNNIQSVRPDPIESGANLPF